MIQLSKVFAIQTTAVLRDRLMGLPSTAAEATKAHKAKVEMVVCYRCPKCSELHEDRSEAELCCAEAATQDLKANEAHPNSCPVCGLQHECTEDAANCCLWKELPFMARLEVIKAVEDGGTWAEALRLPDPMTGLPN